MLRKLPKRVTGIVIIASVACLLLIYSRPPTILMRDITKEKWTSNHDAENLCLQAVKLSQRNGPHGAPKCLVTYSLYGNVTDNYVRKRYLNRLDERVSEIIHFYPGIHHFSSMIHYFI